MNKYKKAIIIGISLLLSAFLIASLIYIFNKKDVEEPAIITEEPLPYADYDFSNLKEENYLVYEDENYTSSIGIDVSAHQDKIDWSKVKQAGIDFAFIRIGYRGATQGLLHIDNEFENNYEGAKNNNIKIGVYFYSQAVTRKEAREEAQYVLDALVDKQLDLPIVFDYEEPIFYDGDVSRIANISPMLRNKIAETFVEEIKNHGHDIMIYTNKQWILNYYDNNFLLNNDIWFAKYDTLNPDILVPFKIWQYTDEGIVNGITTNVDLNIMFIRKNDQSE